jgi:hypothetical protein
MKGSNKHLHFQLKEVTGNLGLHVFSFSILDSLNPLRLARLLLAGRGLEVVLEGMLGTNARNEC